MEQGTYPEAAQYFKRVFPASLLPIGASATTTRPTSAIEVIGSQRLMKQLLKVIVAGIAGYSLRWMSKKLWLRGDRY